VLTKYKYIRPLFFLSITTIFSISSHASLFGNKDCVAREESALGKDSAPKSEPIMSIHEALRLGKLKVGEIVTITRTQKFYVPGKTTGTLFTHSVSPNTRLKILGFDPEKGFTPVAIVKKDGTEAPSTDVATAGVIASKEILIVFKSEDKDEKREEKPKEEKKNDDQHPLFTKDSEAVAYAFVDSSFASIYPLGEGYKSDSKRITELNKGSFIEILGKSTEKSYATYYAIRFVQDGEVKLGDVGSYSITMIKPDDMVIDGKKLSPKEFIARYKEIEAKRLERERIAREKREAKERAELEARLGKFKEVLNAQNTEGILAREKINTMMIKGLSKYKTISLLFGNPFREPTATEYAEFKKAATDLVETGFYVVFDADSKAAPAIAQIVGKRGVGITAKATTSAEMSGGAGLVSITNPYLRMEAYANSDKKITSADSIVGRGLAFEDKLDYVLDPEDVFTTPGLNTWRDNIRSNDLPTLGVKDYYKLKRFKTGASVAEEAKPEWTYSSSPKYLEKGKSFTFDVNNVPLDNHDINNVMAYAEEMMEGASQMEHDESGQVIPGGSVFFGSSQSESKFEDLTYGTAHLLGSLGVTGATGGSGGAMEVANTGFYDAGANSIGIPLSGHSLKGERRVAKDAQTATIGASDYELRIPLLLHRRKIIVNAPGGSGTAKEIAVTLIMIGGQPDRNQQIVFLNSKFYGTPFNWLNNSGLPSEFTGRLNIIDKKDEIIPIVDKLSKNPAVKKEDLKTPKAPKARNSNTEFKSKYSSGSSLFGSSSSGSGTHSSTSSRRDYWTGSD